MTDTNKNSNHENSGADGRCSVELLPPTVRATNVSLEVLGDIGDGDLEKTCRTLSRLANFASESLPYWIGDLINACERLGPNRYEQFLEFTPYTLGTLRNLSYLCSRVPPENRNICPLKHTFVVAKIASPSEQRRLLERARDEGLTATEFRRLVNGDKDYKRPAVPKPTIRTSWSLFWSVYGDKLKHMSVEDACKKTWKLLSTRKIEPVGDE